MGYLSGAEQRRHEAALLLKIKPVEGIALLTECDPFDEDSWKDKMPTHIDFIDDADIVRHFDWETQAPEVATPTWKRDWSVVGIASVIAAVLLVIAFFAYSL